MIKQKLTIVCICNICKHEWIPRKFKKRNWTVNDIKHCPECQSPNWNKIKSKGEKNDINNYGSV